MHSLQRHNGCGKLKRRKQSVRLYYLLLATARVSAMHTLPKLHNLPVRHMYIHKRPAKPFGTNQRMYLPKVGAADGVECATSLREAAAATTSLVVSPAVIHMRRRQLRRRRTCTCTLPDDSRESRLWPKRVVGTRDGSKSHTLPSLFSVCNLMRFCRIDFSSPGSLLIIYSSSRSRRFRRYKAPLRALDRLRDYSSASKHHVSNRRGRNRCGTRATGNASHSMPCCLELLLPLRKRAGQDFAGRSCLRSTRLQ